jgi:hypothetical protein
MKMDKFEKGDLVIHKRRETVGVVTEALNHVGMGYPLYKVHWLYSHGPRSCVKGELRLLEKELIPDKE